MYAIITENDSSEWSDRTGELYHYPKRYRRILSPGTKIIYYKGTMRDKRFENHRLSIHPHYFGYGTIKDRFIDKESSKSDYYSHIENYKMFEQPVLILKNNNQYIETIPENRKTNYWRDGVREISKEIYDEIISLANIAIETNELETIENSLEGKQLRVYTTKYERDPKLRQQAINIHGYTCMACKFNFLEKYGELGRGFIHVHHIKPLAQTGEQVVNPRTDLIVLCPNCHYMIHRNSSKVLTLEEIIQILDLSKNK